MIRLLPHQEACLKQLEGKNRVAIYHDMGLGKTYTGSEKMMQLDCRVNLIICQKSKVQDWCEHFDLYSDMYHNHNLVYDLTDKHGLASFLDVVADHGYTQRIIGVINYDLIFRRPDLLKLKDFTLMLDESSLICNEQTKRSKAILKMQPENVILLSGTPTAGKYEKLWSQCRLLGWNIPKRVFWNSYIITRWVDYGGFMQQVVTGYKQVEHLKKKLSEHGAVFLKTEEVMNLPEQIEQKIMLKRSPQYNTFVRDGYIDLGDGTEMFGDNTLTKMLYARQLCGQYHQGKLEAFRDLLNSTEDNLVVFYNFNGELEALDRIAREEGRTPGAVNGHQKDEAEGHDILFVQYQAGAYGLNLQGFSNRIIYYSLPLGKGSCDLWEQSKKRIHRIGQNKTCFYYYLLVQNSIETLNLERLKEGQDYTNYLFE
jgi:SNF2 family DNA or RNA helicase